MVRHVWDVQLVSRHRKPAIKDPLEYGQPYYNEQCTDYLLCKSGP